MPRPISPLRSSYSAYNEHDSALTPRTPHSRAGREAQDRFLRNSDLGLDADGEYHELETAMAEQNAPLLASSSNGSVRKSSRLDKTIWAAIRQRVSLAIGICGIVFLFFLLVIPNKTLAPPEHLSVSIPSSNSSMHMQMMLNYSDYDSFPLEPLAYREECAKFLAGMKGPMGTFWYIPPGGPADVPHKEDSKICNSSITYMLDGYVGLAADLALIAQAAGLAREQNRTFFVDDRHWNRGRWTDHFQDIRSLQPGPEPGCLAPPPEELVACPRTARHWVINSRTALFHFGHHFMDEFEDPYARELRRLKPIFTRAAHSFSHTLRPSASNAALINAARREIGGPYVGVHVRRGDRKAESWRYHGGYVPLRDYADAAQKVGGRVDSLKGDQGLKVWIATDDPDVQQELTDILSDPSSLTADTSSPIQVFSLAASDNAELRTLASNDAYIQTHFIDLGEEERIRATSGAIVDLALISGMWTWDGEGEGEENSAELEAIVCTISSNFCKLSAVGLGWPRAFGFAPGDPDKTLMTMNDAEKCWIEIDNAGAIDPVWRAFELF